MDMNKSPIFQNPDSDGGSFCWPGKSDEDIAFLLFHGFTATTVEVRPMAKFLNDQGFTVAGPLLPGHGVSPEELSHTNYQDWIATAESSYLELSKGHKTIFVIGESMGGLCSLWLASKHPEIRGLMIFAPALKIPNLWQSRLFWPFVKYMHKKNVDLTSPWQGFNIVPLRAAAQVHKFQQKIKKVLPSINQPMIIFQGKLDKTIDPISAVNVLEMISSDDKELVWLDKSSHCILLDNQMELVKTICLEFIHKLE